MTTSASDGAADRKYPSRVGDLLDAAIRAFAVGGYEGTTTAAVAREAGVSQPYIIRVFGTKETLFIQTHKHAGARMMTVMREAGEEAGGFDPVGMGRAYRQLVTEQPETLAVYGHGFAATSHPAIAAESRRQFAELHHLLVALGAGGVEIRDFMARGMLINALLSMRLPEHAAELGMAGFLEETFAP